MGKTSEMYAYARGYYDGRSFGLDGGNPWDGEKNAKLHRLYKEGYECGVADYCRETHPEDEESIDMRKLANEVFGFKGEQA